MYFFIEVSVAQIYMLCYRSGAEILKECISQIEHEFLWGFQRRFPMTPCWKFAVTKNKRFVREKAQPVDESVACHCDTDIVMATGASAGLVPAERKILH